MTTPPPADLLPCPFCGDRMKVRERSAFHPAATEGRAACLLSTAGENGGPYELDEFDYPEWNRRPQSIAGDGWNEAIEAMRARKDAAYEERNKVVAALAKLFPSGIARTNIPGWSEDWHGCVYIDLPTGQVSWHFHDSQAHLFADLPPYPGIWDGHDTDEKYRRLAALARPAQGDEALVSAARAAIVEWGKDMAESKMAEAMIALRAALATITGREGKQP
jgi:hypothetical protein